MGVPIVRFLDYTHDEGGLWMNEGNDGSQFGLFLESPWPFVIMWTCFGFSSFCTQDNSISVTLREVGLMVNCVLQGVDAGILIQQNLYASNMSGKNFWSVPFLLLFIALATNIGF